MRSEPGTRCTAGKTGPWGTHRAAPAKGRSSLGTRVRSLRGVAMEGVAAVTGVGAQREAGSCWCGEIS